MDQALLRSQSQSLITCLQANRILLSGHTQIHPRFLHNIRHFNDNGSMYRPINMPS